MSTWSRVLTTWVTLGILLLALSVIRAAAGEPLEKIRRTVHDVLTITANKNLTPEERRAQVRQTVLQRFGFEEMAQRSLGPHWRTLTQAQRQEFVDLYTDLLQRSYSSRIENFAGGPQDVHYLKEDITGDHASVSTEIVSEHNQRTPVEYRLLRKDGDWKVYDIVIEGISLVNNYRTQFNNIITQDSYAGLLKRMRSKLIQEQAS